jgi:hypothetical protein
MAAYLNYTPRCEKIGECRIASVCKNTITNLHECQANQQPDREFRAKDCAFLNRDKVNIDEFGSYIYAIVCIKIKNALLFVLLCLQIAASSG